MIGVADACQAMRQAGFAPAPWVDEMLAQGCAAFYQYKDGSKVGVYDPAKGGYAPIPCQAGLIVLPELKAAGKLVKKNLGADLVDLGDGVACVEFHTKMNALDIDTFNRIREGLEVTLIEPRFDPDDGGAFDPGRITP